MSFHTVYCFEDTNSQMNGTFKKILFEQLDRKAQTDTSSMNQYVWYIPGTVERWGGAGPLYYRSG